ncbi:MAG TPA: MFS transporter [Anaerohalosphaeraceae bacterium]|nr:MFS transporter [Phycisphaerae bacterium]HOK95887.1 MFS transporter [Anaerohalosphaeraceae bacterium]HOL32634.1 MFS transporter [Anaerohalosphaeraceae bacterium]HPC65024.1 MFS transporter [Anaerohalosphaeraceae bacterium]HPO70847.1 MFS transporter [Anaerohalosphaeraceae bacterium]
MGMKTLPILLAFFVMGVADAMGPMSDAVRQNYQLSNVMATLLSFFVFIAFAVFSVPGGLLATYIGKKKLLLLGLGLNAAAMLIPCLMQPGFALLLVCIFVLGIGTTFLQVAGNPIMRDVSPQGAYGRNLSFAQGFKGIGSTVSSYLVTAIAGFALFESMGWRGVFPIFFILMAVTFVWVATLKIEETKADVPPSILTSLQLLQKPVFAMAVLGIFLYVGAEVCMGRFLLPLLEAMGLEKSTASKFGPAFFFMMLTVGRLAGGAVLTLLTPRTFFRLSAALGLLGAGLLMLGNPSFAILGVLAAGLGFANIWPMLFSITVEEEPQRSSELSGLMCMAISGGALVPLAMSKLVDSGLAAKAFIIPVICFFYLLALSLKGPSKVKPAAAQ